MSTERWQRLERIFADARQLPADARAEFVARRVRRGRRRCEREALRLLAADDASGRVHGEARARPTGAERRVRRMEPASPASASARTPSFDCLAPAARAKCGEPGTSVWVATWRSRSCCRTSRATAERLRRFADEARTAGALNHSEHPHRLRRRRAPRHAVPRLRMPGRTEPAPASRRGTGSAGRSRRRGARSRAGPRGGARARHHSSRPQAGEHVHQVGWRREDSRLRPGEAPVGARRRASGDHATR